MDASEEMTSPSSPAPQETNSPMTHSPSPEEAAPPQRLIITKMILENFKSYAGEKTIGPFHKCFSSVVGPNGSGKSNVIDAMLFVFGKRAKKLRLNKVSELIHNSAAFKDSPLQYARVSVYFQEIIDTGDGDQDYRVVPNSEIVVTRIAKRDNSSQYKLDGKNCSFRQVATYLNSKGIDLDNNRFLILQGEVEMISMMPPKGKTENDEGLLEYLEDIIGSNQYVDQTNEAALKVEELTEHRQEKLNRVKAVEKEKQSLEGAKLEAEGLLSKDRDIRRKKNILFQIQKYNCSKDKQKDMEQKAVFESQIEENVVKLAAAKKRAEEIEIGISEQTKEYDRVHAELVKTKEEFNSYERKDIQMREEMKHLKTNKKKIATKVQKEAAKEAAALQKIEEAKEDIPLLEEEIERLNAAKVEEDVKLEEIFEETKEVTEKLREKLQQKTQELAPVTQERAVFQSALDTVTTEVKLLEDSTNRAKAQVDAAEKELNSLDSKQETLKEKVDEYEKEVLHGKQRIDDAKREEENLAELEKDLAKKYSQLTVSKTANENLSKSFSQVNR